MEPVIKSLFNKANKKFKFTKWVVNRVSLRKIIKWDRNEFEKNWLKLNQWIYRGEIAYKIYEFNLRKRLKY